MISLIRESRRTTRALGAAAGAILAAIVWAAAVGVVAAGARGRDTEADTDPAQQHLEQGKIAIGEAVFETDPAVARARFQAARRAFEQVLDQGLAAPAEVLREARDYITQLGNELEDNRLIGKAVPLRVLVVPCNLEGTLQRFNREKYRELAYKIRDRSDPEIARKVREKSIETVRVATTWSVEDRNYLRGALDRAARLFFEWTRGAGRLEFDMQPLTKRISDLRLRRGGGRALWLLGTTEARAGDQGDEEILERLKKLSPGRYDFVLLVPKYERGDDVLEKPSRSSEERARFAPVDGSVGIGYLALDARSDGKKQDGAVVDRSFEIAIVDRVYELLREAVTRDCGAVAADWSAAFNPAKIDGLDAWLPPCTDPLKRGYREFDRGEPFYREVLGNWVSPGMLRAATRLTSALRESRKTVASGPLAAAICDRDPRSGVPLEVGSPFRIDLRGAPRARAVGILLGGPAPAAMRGQLVVEGDEGELRRPFTIPANPGRPFRVAIADEPLKIRRITIEILNGGPVDEGPGSVDVREVLLFE